MERLLALGFFLLIGIAPAWAQTPMNVVRGQVWTAAQWNAWSATKQDYPVPTPPGSVVTATITLSKAQLLNLFSAPVSVLPAPGAGKAIVIFQSFYVLHYGTTTYLSPGFNNGLFYASPSGAAADAGDNGVFTTASSAMTSSPAGFQGGIAVLNTVENQPVVLANATADMTTGDGTGVLFVFYAIVTIP